MKQGVVEGYDAKEAFIALSEILDLMRRRAQDVAKSMRLPMPVAMALFRLEDSSPMKHLGHELGCDPSFVTSIADALEERALAKRDVDPTDRRVKRLRLTSKGRATKAKLLAELSEDLPGMDRLGPTDREAFVALLRKMVSS